MFAFSFTFIASTGHTSAQFPHPVHFSISTFAAINNILSINTLMYSLSAGQRALPMFYQTPGLVLLNYICTISRKRATAVARETRQFPGICFYPQARHCPAVQHSDGTGYFLQQVPRC
jgi:hypothetical protein